MLARLWGIPSFVLLATAYALATVEPASAGGCELKKFAELAVTMHHMTPVTVAKIDGADVTFVVDSGAFFSVISPSSAAALGLKLRGAPSGFQMRGINGSADVLIANVKDFILSGQVIHDVDFLVGGTDTGGSEAGGNIGVLGQNVLRAGDVEYDLAKGNIRLFKVEHCERASFAYWVGPEENYSRVDLFRTSSVEPHTVGSATLNGEKIRVMFDTGAPFSILSLRAAERAGVTPQSAGAVSGGYTVGFGQRHVQTWIAPFASFKLGEEEIKNSRLRIAKMSVDSFDMLIGADFFLSHRVYVSNTERRMAFTYNGGPVFNLTLHADVEADELPGTTDVPVAPQLVQDDAASQTPDQKLKSAQDLARRGSASAARGDLDGAIADLNRACALSPEDAQLFYERPDLCAQTQRGPSVDGF